MTPAIGLAVFVWGVLVALTARVTPERWGPQPGHSPVYMLMAWTIGIPFLFLGAVLWMVLPPDTWKELDGAETE